MKLRRCLVYQKFTRKYWVEYVQIVDELSNYLGIFFTVGKASSDADDKIKLYKLGLKSLYLL